MKKENIRTMLPADNPISLSEDDALGWAPVARTFARRTLELNATYGMVVGVFGPWGSGKTSYINLARPEFEKNKVPVLDFNPWLFSGADQLVGRFFAELSSLMDETSNLKKIGRDLRKYGDVITPTIAVISTLGGVPQAEQVVNAMLKFCKKKTAPSTSVTVLRKKLTDALAQRDRPIVVVLDDVDRLPADEIREVFKLVRLTASFPNLIYIVACDRVRVESAFDEGAPPPRANYLEKIFQWSVNVPATSRELLRGELLRSIENAFGDVDSPFNEGDWADIEVEIIWPLIQNMRDVRRYCMAIRGTINDLGNTVALVDVLALEAIRLFMPRVFDALPSLVEDLTVLPVWEGNQQHAEDIILDQMGDTEKIAEMRHTRLDKLIEAGGTEHRRVVRALLHRLFPGGCGQQETQGPEWISEQLRNNRVAHGIIFRFYLTRVTDSDLTASNHAKHAFKCLHDQCALHKFMNSQDSNIWPETILSLWSMFRNEFVRRHAEPGLIVFWNMLLDRPEGYTTFRDEPLTFTLMISKSLLETLVDSDDIADTIHRVFRQLKSFSSKVALITQVKGFNSERNILMSKSEISAIEGNLKEEILSATADDLAEERHPAQVLYFSNQCSDPPTIPHFIHDSPRLTFALLWDCKTEGSISELGSRATEIRQGIHWDTLVSIHCDENLLKARIESLNQNYQSMEAWIESDLGIPAIDARELLELANEYSVNGDRK